MDMGRINNIIQRHFDERIEQKLAFLTERVEKLEKIVLDLKSQKYAKNLPEEMKK
jgi:hypothetical protein